MRSCLSSMGAKCTHLKLKVYAAGLSLKFNNILGCKITYCKTQWGFLTFNNPFPGSRKQEITADDNSVLFELLYRKKMCTKRIVGAHLHRSDDTKRKEKQNSAAEISRSLSVCLFVTLVVHLCCMKMTCVPPPPSMLRSFGGLICFFFTALLVSREATLYVEREISLMKITECLFCSLCFASPSNNVEPRKPPVPPETKKEPAALCQGCRWETTASPGRAFLSVPPPDRVMTGLFTGLVVCVTGRSSTK